MRKVILMTGLYGASQFNHIMEGLRKLSATSLPIERVIIYTRPALIPLLARLRGEWRNWGILYKLTGGISLHGGTPDKIYDYILDIPYPEQPPRPDTVYADARWQRIGTLIQQVRQATGIYACALVSEPDPMQLGKIVDPAYAMEAMRRCWAIAASQRCQLWVDQPTITTRTEDANYVAKVLGFGSAHWQGNSWRAVQFMPLEPTTLGMNPPTEDWRSRTIERWNALAVDITGTSNWHNRFAVAATTDASFPWTWATMKAALPEFWRRNRATPIAYVRHDDWVTVCEQIAGGA